MKLSTRGRYAVTAMLDIAMRHERGVVALAEVATRQGLSLAYLEQLFAQLRRRDLVVSTRGPGGGYALSRSPAAISVAQIIDAIDENIDTTLCGGNKNCAADAPCLTHYLWAELGDRIRNFLSGVTLGDLMMQPHVIEVAERQEQRREIPFTH